MTEPNDPLSLQKRYGAGNYDPLPVTLVRGEGAYVWDDRGRRYLDMMSAYSALSHGHRHPRLLAALNDQLGRITLTSRAFDNDRLGPFLARACTLTGMDKALPMNTGVEAVETALKAARKWAYRHKGIPPDRAEIIACQGNFHGRTIAVLGLSSEESYRRGFGPFPAGMETIPYGDAGALEQAITPATAAFLVEPIQGEGGIIVPPEGYLRACADICRRHRVLLLADEIQTGLGRTGRLLAVEHEGVHPDGLMLGKALGGGLLPVSLFLARRELMDVFAPGDHGSTFGGNPLAAAVGLAALDVLVEEDLSTRAAHLGAEFLARLRTLAPPLVHEIRGRGLFVGIELVPGPVSAREVCLALLKEGILAKDTHENVIRLAPPLIVAEADLLHAADTVSRVLVRVATAARFPHARTG